MTLRCKRAYEEPAAEDGCRILVDRLWPRGLSRQTAGIDLWLKDVAPSHELRRWFGHDPSRWNEFQNRYREELAAREAELSEIRRRLAEGPVTLVFGAKDEAHNNAVALRSLLVELNAGG